MVLLLLLLLVMVGGILGDRGGRGRLHGAVILLILALADGAVGVVGIAVGHRVV